MSWTVLFHSDFEREFEDSEIILVRPQDERGSMMTTLRDMMDKLPEDRRQKIEKRAFALVAEEKARRDFALPAIVADEVKLAAKKNLVGAEASPV